MGTGIGQHGVSVAIEAELVTQLLPKCAACGAPHPIATGADNPLECPKCLTPSNLGAEQTVPAEVTPPFLVRAYLWIANQLRALARSIAP